MKIATLSTYPAKHARGGGQHRLRNIIARFAAAGHTVTPVGVLGSTGYPPVTGYLPCPVASLLERYISNFSHMEDWAIGQLFVEDDEHFTRLAALIPADTELIHVEQPWLFQFARRYASERRGLPPTLLYGSANVEHELKRKIVANQFSPEHAEYCARLVLECELDALRHADLTCAVSESDAAWMRPRTRADVVLAANGADDHPFSLKGIERANLISGHHAFALYSASAHLPNIVGFYEMFGRGLGCLAPNERLVVAGGAGHAIRGDERFGKTPGLGTYLATSGEVDDECLAGLVRLAHAILLPITQGGGTNLKTAEAIWAGHHIVATTSAMRGFEQYCNSPGVTVVSDPIEFRHAVRNAMASPPPLISVDERERRRAVLWERTLAPLVDRVAQMAH